MPQYIRVCVICQKEFTTSGNKPRTCSPKCRAKQAALTRYSTDLSPEKVIENFWSSLDKNHPDGCWVWTRLTIHGYGYFGFHGKTWRAHRFAYYLTHGEIPDNLLVCHACDNPPCCNPDHLWLGTDKDNALDRQKKRRHRVRKENNNFHFAASSTPIKLTPPPKVINTRILTEKSVIEIRKLYETGNYMYKELGGFYGVDASTIGLIIRRVTWTHI